MILNSKYKYLSTGWVLLFALFLLAGCGQKPHFSETIVLADNFWIDGHKLTFEFDIVDTVSVFDMDLIVTLDKVTYPYQNLYVKISTFFPSGEQHDQILSLNMFSRIGYAEGTCSGDECEIPITIQQNIFFPATGRYQLSLLPWMRIDTIPGIHAIGLEINAAQDVN